MKIDESEYCDKCESLITNDWCQDRALDLRLSGGYAMFIDLVTIDLIFCHSCAVEFFRSIPSLSSDKINGMHSVAYTSSDYPLCCEYSWTLDDNSNKTYATGEVPVILGTKDHFDKRK